MRKLGVWAGALLPLLFGLLGRSLPALAYDGSAGDTPNFIVVGGDPHIVVTGNRAITPTTERLRYLSILHAIRITEAQRHQAYTILTARPDVQAQLRDAQAWLAEFTAMGVRSGPCQNLGHTPGNHGTGWIATRITTVVRAPELVWFLDPAAHPPNAGPNDVVWIYWEVGSRAPGGISGAEIHLFWGAPWSRPAQPRPARVGFDTTGSGDTGVTTLTPEPLTEDETIPTE